MSGLTGVFDYPHHFVIPLHIVCAIYIVCNLLQFQHTAQKTIKMSTRHFSLVGDNYGLIISHVCVTIHPHEHLHVQILLYFNKTSIHLHVHVSTEHKNMQESQTSNEIKFGCKLNP